MRTTLLALVITLPALAGPIAPPPGPIAESYKTLTDVEPRTAIRNLGPFSPIVISQSGSYYLAENINALPTQHGIEITVSNVTLDLNGFTIKGDMDAGSLDGVHLASNADSCEIKNGVIIGFVGYGLNAFETNNGIVAHLRVQSNGNGGIRAWKGWLVESCIANSNSNYGIASSHGTTISNCVAFENAGDGINGGVGCVISNCASRGNTQYGINSGNRTVVADCSASDNGWDGIYVPQRSVIRSCVAVDNGQDGIRSINHGLIIDCLAVSNDEDGIEVDNGMVKNCLARSNVAVNINAINGSTLIDNH